MDSLTHLTTNCAELPKSTISPRPSQLSRPAPANYRAPPLVSYSASKAALSQFTAGLRADLRGLPIGSTLFELGPIPTDMLAKTKNYEPTAKSFQRLYRTRLVVNVPRETVADKVVEAVQKGRRHVRPPHRAAAFAMLAEAPRRATEVLLTGVPHQAK